jgi:trans-aconitate 2-methyltransferase
MTGKEWDSAAYNRLSDPQRAWGMKVLARLRLTGDETVMDAGCGTGRLTAELLEALPRGRVVAVDLSENMLEKAQENLVRYGERVAYVHADLGHLPFEAEFNVIFSTAAFHWVKDHEALFRGLFRALKPGGWLEAQCGGGPNLGKVLKRADALMQSATFAPFFKGGSAWDPWEFTTPETAVRRMREAGFDGAEAWLEPAAFRLETPEKFREFAATAIFHPHLGKIPQPDLREEFLNRIVEGSDLELDYWRLNLRGSKPPD